MWRYKRLMRSGHKIYLCLVSGFMHCAAEMQNFTYSCEFKLSNTATADAYVINLFATRHILQNTKFYVTIT